MNMSIDTSLYDSLISHLNVVYEDIDLDYSIQSIAENLILMMRLNESNLDDNEIVNHHLVPYQNHWSEEDIILITYGNSLINDLDAPLKVLSKFLENHCKGIINGVHILPFFPYTSDDGFAVSDYFSVDNALGDWSDIKFIAKDYRLMSDLVINHCSSSHPWFASFIAGKGEGHDFFYTLNAEDDLSKVVRPRASDLIRETQTEHGVKKVWCTFSHDQIDFDFRNPKVLIKFVEVIRHYLDNGVNIFRFDAVAFLWKVPGTSSMNLLQTHEIVRLLRLLIENAQPGAMVITETNIPNRENLTYFGNANEAHAIYNFSLPPLLVNTLLMGNCRHLKTWMMSMPPAQNGTAYFNFIASHDGIGLRPTEGLLEDEEVDTLLKTIESFGGKISWRSTGNGERKAYEMNISLFDALQGTVNGKDEWGMQRFICAHAIMFSLEGVPGLYIHSLLATSNDLEKVETTGQARGINRHQWQEKNLQEVLENQNTQHAQALKQLTNLLKVRTKQPAFHPNAVQFTLQLGQQLFGFWRQSHDRKQSIFCISNISNETKTLRLSSINLIGTDAWLDLVTGQPLDNNISEIQMQPYQTLWISNRQYFKDE